MPVITDIILIFLLSTIPAAFNYFLDYCLGRPMDDKPNPKEIFSGYSLWLAKRRLKIERVVVLHVESEDNKAIMLEAQKYYTWEKAMGMCIYCTGFWCALIAAAIFYFTIPLSFINKSLMFLLVPIFSHSILRRL